LFGPEIGNFQNLEGMSEQAFIEKEIASKEAVSFPNIGELFAERLAKKEEEGLKQEGEIRKNIVGNVSLAKEWLGNDDEDLQALLDQPVDEANKAVSTPNLEKIVNKLNYLAEQEPGDKIRFIGIGDQLPLPLEARTVKAIYPDSEEWTEAIIDLMLSKEGREEKLAFISGTNFMDNSPIYNKNGERLVYLPISYLTVPASA
jgi:hypothetical protein